MRLEASTGVSSCVENPCPPGIAFPVEQGPGQTDSMLQCEVNRTGVLLLGNELLHVFPQELPTKMCDSDMPPATWCPCPQRSLFLVLASGAASS